MAPSDALAGIVLAAGELRHALLDEDSNALGANAEELGEVGGVQRPVGAVNWAHALNT